MDQSGKRLLHKKLPCDLPAILQVLAPYKDRKKQKTNPVIATKALACKLAKAAWHVMHDDAAYDPQRVFGGGAA
jgi:hypothetical protein